MELPLKALLIMWFFKILVWIEFIVDINLYYILL